MRSGDLLSLSLSFLNISGVLYHSEISEMCFRELAAIKVRTLGTMLDPSDLLTLLDTSFPEDELELWCVLQVSFCVDLIEDFSEYFIHGSTA